MNTFDFTPLLPALGSFRVYTKALTLAHTAYSLPIEGSLRDQLVRAGESVVLNVGEGAGSSTPATKRKYYAIARASEWELASCMDLARLRGISVEASVGGELDEVNRMLTRLIRG